MTATRSALLEATKELLAEDGYVATSPRDILARSGAGQGALYHHFRGKNDLVACALREVSADMCADADAVLDAQPDPVQAVLAWLTAPRQALRGCRLGRLTGEPIQAEASLQEPIGAYFQHVQNSLAERLSDAAATGRLTTRADPAELATTVVAVVQGGYVIARATGDPDAMTRAQHAAAALLTACSENPRDRSTADDLRPRRARPPRRDARPRA